jgi:hypothetical protein
MGVIQNKERGSIRAFLERKALILNITDATDNTQLKMLGNDDSDRGGVTFKCVIHSACVYLNVTQNISICRFII